MKVGFAAAVLAGSIGAFGFSGSAVAACDPAGTTKFICGMRNSEDLVQIPETRWVVASGLAEGDNPEGHLYIVNTRDYSLKVLLPGHVAYRQDMKTYGDCPGAPEEKTFSAHGLNIRRGANGEHTLYVVHHGGRESIEVFKLSVKGEEPRLTWIGCAVYPAETSGNAVAPLPGGGFAATSLFNPKDAKFAEKLLAREPIGSTFIWRPTRGWEIVADSLTISGDNGVETSRDGKWLFIAGWADESVVRLSLDRKNPRREVVKTGFHTDNLRWGPDGFLYAGGQHDSAQNIFTCFASKSEVCANPYAVLKIDPKTLRTQEIVDDPGSPAFGGGTTGMKVGNTYWIGTFRGDRIAIVSRK